MPEGALEKGGSPYHKSGLFITKERSVVMKKVIEKQWTGTGANKRQIPLLKPKGEINK